MSRRANAKPAGVQMFPFLAVLICTMGALVVLLHAFARHGQLEAIKMAKANVKSPQIEVEDFEWRSEHIRAARAKTQAQLADERLKLAHVEDHARRLQEKLDQLKLAAERIKRANTEKDDQSQQRAAQLEATKAEVDEAQAALDAARRAGRKGRVNYSVVPYDGLQATHRRPIYIECREDSIVLQPEGIELTPRDFAGYFGPSNPLAAAVRAQREYFARQAPDGQLAEEPYPLLLVRPEGVKTYLTARKALVSWGSDFGYELIGSDWELKYRDPDPQLAKFTRQVVDEARVRHRQYTLTSPHVARRRSRPVYHARSHGGFALEGGSSYSPRRGGSNPWDDSGDDWSGGTDLGAGDDPYGAVDRHDGLSPGGNATLKDAYASAQGRKVFSPGGNSKSRDPYGSIDGRDGHSPGGNSDSEDPDGDSADGRKGDQRLAARNPRDSDIPGALGGTENDPQVQDGGNPGGSASSRSGQPSGDSRERNSPSGGPSNDDSQSPSPSHGAKKSKPQSIATTRGRDWGLPGSGGRSVSATRPIRVLCYPDRLVVMPDSQGQVPREIPLQAQTRDSIDELVSAVWDHMQAWGKAGRQLYWRPLLSIDIQPGAVVRYGEIEALLANSGIDVQRRQPRAAPRRGSRPAMRQPIRQ